MQKVANYRSIWALSWPMLLSNISVPLLGLVDTAILGHLDDAHYLAAVAMGTSVLSFIYFSFNFLRMSTTGCVAQAVGKQNHGENFSIGFRGIIISVAIGSTIIILQPFILHFSLSFMGDDKISLALAYEYASIRIYSAPAVLTTFVIVGWFIGNKKTLIPLIMVVIANSLNIALDYLLIIHLEMNSEGAAYATLIAEYTAAIVGLVYFLRAYTAQRSCLSCSQIFSANEFKALLLINQPLFVRTLLLLTSYFFFTSQGANQSLDIVAANAILMSLIQTISYAMDGFAHACEAYCGDALGQKNMALFHRVIALCFNLCLLTAVLFTVFFIVFKQPLINLLTSLDDIKELLSRYWIWLVLSPLLSFMTYLMDGIFVAATATQSMRNTLAVSLFLVYFPTWWLTLSWGNHGLWFSFSAFTLCRFIALYVVFIKNNKSNRWSELTS